MKHYRNPKTGAVFAYEADGSQDAYIPRGYVKMTDEELVSHIQPMKPSRDQVEAQRLAAYADPLTGSDRFFAEAVRLEAMGVSEDQIKAARSSGIARHAEIQAQYPWPDDPSA